MAIKYADNFGFWSTIALGTLTNSYSNSGVNSVSGGQFLSGGQGSGALVSNQITSQATYIVNLRFNVDRLGNGRAGGQGTLNGPPLGFTPLLNLNQGGGFGGNLQSGLGIRSDGKLQFYNNLSTGTPIGAVSPSAIHADSGVTFYDAEYKIFINSTTGTIEARLNGGVEIGPTSGVVTQSTGSAVADSLTIWGYSSADNSNTPGMRIEHVVIMDTTGSSGNDFLGPIDVDLLPPTGNGFYTDWAFTGGATAWQSVNELNPDEDATYISTGTINAKETFTHGALPGGTTNVKAVVVWVRARRDDAIARSFKVLLRSSGTDQLGTEQHFVGDNYLWFMSPFSVSPFTLSAWGVSEVNNLQYGAQVIS